MNVKKGTIKTWIKEHKMLIAGGALTTATVVMALVCKNTKRVNKLQSDYIDKIQGDKDVLWTALSNSEKDISDIADKRIKFVDEDIFTSLACDIENAVTCPGIEKVVFERSYDMGDNLHKLVTTTVENVYGD